MASRWRIRHKLILGPGLVVLLMAVLLSGTLRGLYSYYLTTISIRAKLDELFVAEGLRDAVAQLTSEDVTEKMFRDQAFEEAQVGKIKESIAAYSEQVEKTLSQTNDSRRGSYEKDNAQCLLELMTAYQQALRPLREQPQVGMRDDQAQMKARQEKLARPRKQLLRQADDIRDDIKEELAQKLYATRGHYQVALWIVVPTTIVGLLVLAGLMRSFYGWVLTPIRDLEKGVARVAQGDMQHRIILSSGDEMEDLARAFNDMVGRLQAVYADLANQVNERSRQLVRSERLASVGFLAAGVAHEINNPLASIAFCGEALEARLSSLTKYLRVGNRAAEEHDIFAKYLKMIQEEAFRCKHITERLLEFSRTGEPRREVTDLRGLVQAVLDVTQHLSNHKGKQILLEVPAERGGRISAWVNGEEIKSVILNLVVNALESMDEEGQLTIRLTQKDGQAELRFTDTGCGMNQEVLENIFEPFFTRSRTGKGTGLGLTISHLIISQHGGDIQVSSPGPGLGSTFVVRLPTQPGEMVGDTPMGNVSGNGPAVQLRAA